MRMRNEGFKLDSKPSKGMLKAWYLTERFPTHTQRPKKDRQFIYSLCKKEKKIGSPLVSNLIYVLFLIYNNDSTVSLSGTSSTESQWEAAILCQSSNDWMKGVSKSAGKWLLNSAVFISANNQAFPDCGNTVNHLTRATHSPVLYISPETIIPTDWYFKKSTHNTTSATHCLRHVPPSAVCHSSIPFLKLVLNKLFDISWNPHPHARHRDTDLMGESNWGCCNSNYTFHIPHQDTQSKWSKASDVKKGRKEKEKHKWFLMIYCGGLEKIICRHSFWHGLIYAR